MATTHKASPQAIARKVMASNPTPLDRTGLVCLTPAEVENRIMLGIAAYTDESNQRPENLSEACARLGINLHWKHRHDIPALNLSNRLSQSQRYAIFFGHRTALSTHSHEEPCILELENLHEQYPDVQLWVEAVL